MRWPRRLFADMDAAMADSLRNQLSAFEKTAAGQLLAECAREFGRQAELDARTCAATAGEQARLSGAVSATLAEVMELLLEPGLGLDTPLKEVMDRVRRTTA